MSSKNPFDATLYLFTRTVFKQQAWHEKCVYEYKQVKKDSSVRSGHEADIYI